MEKEFHGPEGSSAEQEYEDIDLPETCPVCGADLVITIADGGTDPGVPVDATTPDGFDPDSVIERWGEIEEEDCAVSPGSGQEGGGDE
jgi:hypothetical protein